MKIKPLNNFLVLKIVEKKKSPILLADTVEKDKPEQGEIVQVSDKETFFKVGQEVLFEKYGVVELEIDKEKVYLIDKRDVVAIIE